MGIIKSTFNNIMSYIEHRSTPKNKSFSCKLDLPDNRDYTFNLSNPSIPQKIDLRPVMSMVENQGDLGSCAAQAAAGGMEYLENKNAPMFVDISRLFIYYQARSIDNNIGYDTGASMRSVMKACATVGACKEYIWPYNISKFTRKPSTEALDDAKNRKLTAYYRITNLTDLKISLAAGYPVAFGFMVYESFLSPEVSKTGIMPVPSKNESLLGGHGVLCVGYDDTTKHIIVRNSWGDGWGQKGYFMMPYDYVSNPNMCFDFWSMQK
jgi:C1A family cysteine protease